MVRIAFFLPQVTRPAGGHAILIEHVTMLRKAGYDALIMSPVTSSESYYRLMIPYEVLVEDSELIESIVTDTSAYLVLTEADVIRYASKLVSLRGTDLRRIVILNQNHFYTFNFGEDSASWKIFRACTHLVTSRSIRRFLISVTRKRDIQLVPVFINHDLFKPRAKLFRVAYMPRKMPSEADFVRRVFLELAPDLAGVPWVAIENQTQADVAAILNHSAVFISFARREGFGMPALEAMASGCVVVGFSGVGGREYASASNGIWVDDDDIVALASSLVQVCRDLIVSPERSACLVSEALASAQRYNREATELALLTAWDKITGGITAQTVQLFTSGNNEHESFATG